MKNPTSTLLMAALCLGSMMSGCSQKTMEDGAKTPEENTEMSTAMYVERGEYLVTIIGCDHCHTPKKMTDQGPVPDHDRWLMGHPADSPLPPINKNEVGPGKWVLFHGDLTASVGPWGISYSANLTPHETGIGSWTYEQFKKSMTEGKHKGMDGGRMVLPPMPWQSLAELDEDDLRSIYEYLKTIPPIDNLVPSPVPPTEL
jgi:hypothetical protein